MQTCHVCDEPPGKWLRGYCPRHYQKLMRHGDPLWERPRVARRIPPRERQRKWRETHPRENRASILAGNANTWAKIHGVPGRLRRADVLPFLDMPCHYCGRLSGEDYRERVGIDHVIAMSRGGPNVVENLVPCCQACNVSKRHAERPVWGTYYRATEAAASQT